MAGDSSATERLLRRAAEGDAQSWARLSAGRCAVPAPANSRRWPSSSPTTVNGYGKWSTYSQRDTEPPKRLTRTIPTSAPPGAPTSIGKMGVQSKTAQTSKSASSA